MGERIEKSVKSNQTTADILIANFDDIYNTGDKFNFPGRLEEEIRLALQSSSLNHVTVSRIDSIINSYDAAKTVAAETRAKIVIYGRYDDVAVRVNMFVNEVGLGDYPLLRTRDIPLTAAETPSELRFVVSEVVPKSTVVLSLFVLGQIQYLSNNAQAGRLAFDAAMTSTDSAISIENEDIIQFLAARNLTVTGVGSPEEIVCGYAKALEINPNLAAAYNNIALIIWSQQDDARKWELYEPVIDSGGVQSLGISKGIIECLSQAGIGNFSLEAFFEKAYQLGNKWQVPRFNRIASNPQYNYIGENYDFTIDKKAELEEITRIDPTLVGPYIVLGIDELKSHAYDRQYYEAIKYFQKALALNSEQPELYVNIAQAYLGTGQLDMAENYFNNALPEKHTRVESLLGLANIAFQHQDFAKVFQFVDQIPITSTAFPLGQILHSHTAFIQSDVESAIQILQNVHVQKSAISNESTGDNYLDFLIATLLDIEGDIVQATAYYSAIDRGRESPYEENSAIHGETSATTLSDAWKQIRDMCSGVIGDWWSIGDPCIPTDPYERADLLYRVIRNLLLVRIYDYEIFSVPFQCPLVFTFDTNSMSWIYETPILYQLVGEHNEQDQMRLLANFEGRLLIREIEPEVSYIDAVWLIIESTDGHLHELRADHHLLYSSDRKYLIMHQGDEVVIKFPGFKEIANPLHSWVVARGYYIPTLP